MNEPELRKLRDRVRQGWLTLPFSMQEATGLQQLAEMVVFPDEQPQPAENEFVGRYGECTTLGNFAHGTLYETLSGRRRVILQDDRQMDLSTGIVEHYNKGALGREIHLPEPQPQPAEPTLEERLWEWAQRHGAIFSGFDTELRQLLDERKAQQEATP